MHTAWGIKKNWKPMCCQLSQGQDLTAIRDRVGQLTWLEYCHGWLCTFRKDKSERWGAGVAVYVKGKVEYIEIYSGADTWFEGLWVRIKGQVDMGHTCWYLLQATYSDHEMVELRILHRGSKSIRTTRTLNFQRANFGLFKDLLRGIP